jgi:hypothetical protein
MFRGQDPATGAQRRKPLLRADPRSKLPAAPLLATLKAHAAEQRIAELEQLAGVLSAQQIAVLAGTAQARLRPALA